MAEYIVEFDTTYYDHMVADGIIKETDNKTLHGMPVRGEIIRCRDCDSASDRMSVGINRYKPCPVGKRNCLHFAQWNYEYDEPGNYLVELDCFCSWAERDK